MEPCEVRIFDLFGVVVAFDDDLVSRRIAGHCPEPTSAFEAMRGLVSDPDLICGRRTLAQLHDVLCRAHGLTLDLASFETLWRQSYSQPMPGMAELLMQLSRRHKLLLLSNVDPYYWQVVLEGHAELGCFSECLLSWQLGVAKPERAAFAHAVGRAGVPASQCLFIDDKLENIRAAKSLGIEGHHCSSVGALETSLRQSGVG